MTPTITGLHHVTMIGGPPQPNFEFYSGVLGLRLVKKTVNFDDPFTYHLYYGDETGHPGTILTFFPWAGVPAGRPGNGQVAEVSLGIPQDSLAYWQTRLEQFRVPVVGPVQRFGESVLNFRDPDGLPLELITYPGGDPDRAWKAGPVPAGHAVTGVHTVALYETDALPTAKLLTETLGWRVAKQEGPRTRYEAGDGGSGAYLDVLSRPDGARGRSGAGIVHHVAFRTPDDEQQVAWHRLLTAARHPVSPIMDRNYFHSIYFREPGGVLFEIATDPPGFLIDEPQESLGTHLKLPPWEEQQRDRIAAHLPPLEAVRA